MNIASPRRGSPPVITAASTRSWVRSREYSHTIPTSATKNSSAANTPRDTLVEGERSMALLRSLEPLVEQHERGEPVHQPARDPHQQARKLLVRDGIEA